MPLKLNNIFNWLLPPLTVALLSSGCAKPKAHIEQATSGADSLCIDEYNLIVGLLSEEFDSDNRKCFLSRYSLYSEDYEKLKIAEEMIRDVSIIDSSKIESVFEEDINDTCYIFSWYEIEANFWEEYCSGLQNRLYIIHRLNLNGRKSNTTGTRSSKNIDC